MQSIQEKIQKYQRLNKEVRAAELSLTCRQKLYKEAAEALEVLKDARREASSELFLAIESEQ